MSEPRGAAQFLRCRCDPFASQPVKLDRLRRRAARHEVNSNFLGLPLHPSNRRECAVIVQVFPRLHERDCTPQRLRQFGQRRLLLKPEWLNT